MEYKRLIVIERKGDKMDTRNEKEEIRKRRPYYKRLIVLEGI